jgi:hypothetical protein
VETATDAAKRIVNHRRQLDHHGQEGTQHGLRLRILVSIEQADHALQECVQLARDPERLVLRKPAASLEL